MKIKLKESDLRKIARKTILKNEVADKKNKIKSVELEVEEKDTEFKDLVSQNSTDNLAQKESGSAQRGGDVGVAAAAAGAVAYGLSSSPLAMLGAGAVLASPPGMIAGGLILGASLYYVFAPSSTGTDATKEALDTTLYKRTSAGFRKIYSQIKKSDDPEIRKLAEQMNPDKCLDVPSPEETIAIAKKLYTATQGGSFTGAFTGGSGLFGIGTDESAIRDALKSCGSYLGISKVSYKHAKTYEGVFFNDGDLLKVFTGELDRADMEEYVNAVIEGMPYIIINDKPYMKNEFQEWLIETKNAADKALQEEPEPEEPEEVVPEQVVDYSVSTIQELMVQYCSKNNLDFVSISTDGKWGPKTERLWSGTYLPHVVANHPEFSKIEIDISNSKWVNISSQLIGQFPSYTSGVKGCTNFCIDALNGNNVMGSKKGGPDTAIKYFTGRKRKRTTRKETIEDTPEESQAASKKTRVFDDGRLTYKNIKIDVDVVGDRQIKKLSELPRAASDADQELKFDFLTNFSNRKLNLPNGETFQLNITPKPNGEIKFQHRSTKLFKAMNIRSFAEPFRRFFRGLNLSAAELSKLRIDKKNPIVIKVIMPRGLYNPTVDRD